MTDHRDVETPKQDGQPDPQDGDGRESEQDKIRRYREQVEARAAEELEGLMSDVEDEKAVQEIDSGFVRECLMLNQLGDGKLYAAMHRGRFAYNKSTKEWMHFNGHHWEIDEMDLSAAECERIVERYREEAFIIGKEMNELPDDDPNKARLGKLKKKLWERISALRGDRRDRCLKWAHTNDDPLAVHGKMFDTNPWLLPCPNGVIDLTTGEFRDGRPEDYLFKACRTLWKGLEERNEDFEKAVLQIMSDREDVYLFVQRLLGSALVGEDIEHIFVMATGRGRNGKDTIFETIQHVLGDLAGVIPPEMLLQQASRISPNSPTPDIMAMKGLRYAIASETDEHARFSPGRVKWLTGGGTLTGRWPNDKYPVRFKPTHTLFLATNCEPHAPADDFAFWERLIVVPFDLSFIKNRKPKESYEREADSYLKAKLRENPSGILAWLVNGCLMWQRDGLKPPPLIKRATDQYRRNEDLLQDFIDACCEVGDDIRGGASDLYVVYTAWFHDFVAKRHPAQKTFGNMMAKKFERDKVGGVYWYFGVRLKDHIQGYLDSVEKKKDIDEQQIQTLIRYEPHQDDRGLPF